MLTILRAGAEPEQRELSGAASAGGSLADLVSIPGVPAAALRLEPCAAGVVVEARAAGLRAASHPLPPGARRLLRSGEELALGGARIRIGPCAEPEATRAAAAALVRDAVARAAPPVLGPHLVVLTGADAGARHVLAEEQLLGRGRASAIRLADPRASRRHARLCLGPGGATLEDLGSKNGLRVNGIAIERGPRPLRDGDEITVGDTTFALALVRAGPPPGAPPAAGEGEARPAPRPGPRVAAAALLLVCAAALALAS